MTFRSKRYGPANCHDEAIAMAADSTGNVFVTGISAGANGYFDYATVKYSSVGEPLWTRRYNGPGNLGEVARGIVVERSGNVFVTGGSDGIGGLEDYATIAYSNAGALLWTNRYNGPGNGE